MPDSSQVTLQHKTAALAPRANCRPAHWGQPRPSVTLGLWAQTTIVWGMAFTHAWCRCGTAAPPSPTWCTLKGRVRGQHTRHTHTSIHG
jgi:hypothetical protein